MSNFIWPFEYLGPWTDLDEAGPPVSPLDYLAMIHDYEYDRADGTGGHLGRVQKAKADFAMAGATDNPFVKFGLYTQGMIRVFTFNQINLPW